MAVIDQTVTERYALYHGDCMDVIADLPPGSAHLSVYSPPFCGLYHYSSSDRDLSNCRSYEEFFEHYRFVVEGIHAATMPGRMTAVHCMDVPSGNSGKGDHLTDFPGDIIRLHEKCGFHYVARYCVWKEPLGVRIRTMIKGLEHQRGIIEDSSQCCNASADYLLVFRRCGENPVPIQHPSGLMKYAGAREVPAALLPYRGWSGKQTENKYSQWIWRQYASAFWDDIRIDRTLPFKPARDEDDIRHVHPLQLDVIDRIVQLWSNPEEVVLTPFMGVGSEVFSAVSAGRRGIGAELKDTYYRQAVRNLKTASEVEEAKQLALFGAADRPADAALGTRPDIGGYPGAKQKEFFK